MMTRVSRGDCKVAGLPAGLDREAKGHFMPPRPWEEAGGGGGS